MLAIDSKLLEQARGQDNLAWETIVRSYTRYLYKLCARFVHNRADLEDLTQEVFIRVFKSLNDFCESEGSFISWITVIAKNLAIDYCRRKKRYNAAFTEGADFTVIAQRHSHSEPPEAFLVRKERTRRLQEGLRLMSPSLRRVLVLRELEGNSYQEIAKQLQVPEGTVKSRLSRSRNQFMKIFQALEQGPPAPAARNVSERPH